MLVIPVALEKSSGSEDLLNYKICPGQGVLHHKSQTPTISKPKKKYHKGTMAFSLKPQGYHSAGHRATHSKSQAQPHVYSLLLKSSHER